MAVVPLTYTVFLPVIFSVASALSPLPQKGLAGCSATTLAQVGGSWCYNWTPVAGYDNSTGRIGILRPGVTEQQVRDYAAPFVLAFNEPNIWDQDNLTPDAAAQLYHQWLAWLPPQVKVFCCGTITMGGTNWQEQFKAAYQVRYGEPPRIDGIHFHAYSVVGGCDTDENCLASFQQQVQHYAAYAGSKPAWLSEFNWHWQPADYQTTARRVGQMCRWLNGAGLVDRYALFVGLYPGWNPVQQYAATVDSSGNLTAVGTEYQLC